MDVIAGDTLDGAALEAAGVIVKFEFEFWSPPHRHQPQLIALADNMNPLQRESHSIKYLLRAQVLVREAEQVAINPDRLGRKVLLHGNGVADGLGSLPNHLGELEVALDLCRNRQCPGKTADGVFQFFVLAAICLKPN